MTLGGVFEMASKNKLASRRPTDEACAAGHFLEVGLTCKELCSKLTVAFATVLVCLRLCFLCIFVAIKNQEGF